MITTLKEQTKSPDKFRRPSYTVGDSKVIVKEESHKICGESRRLKRVFVCDPTTQEPGVGWIVGDNVIACMVCGEPFGMFRWPHHCRCCGNIVCNPCSPEVVEVVELQNLGPVRVCVVCYWGQDPVHANFHKVISDTPDVVANAATDDMATSAKKRLTPTPFFLVEFQRKLSFQESGKSSLDARKTRLVFVNVCTHEAMLNLPPEQEFVVCDEVYSIVEVVDGVDSEADIYHILLRPDLAEGDISEENAHQFEEVCIYRTLLVDFFVTNCFNKVATVMVNEIVNKFNLRSLKKIRVCSDRKYVGSTANVVSIPSRVTPGSLRGQSTFSHHTAVSLKCLRYDDSHYLSAGYRDYSRI